MVLGASLTTGMFFPYILAINGILLFLLGLLFKTKCSRAEDREVELPPSKLERGFWRGSPAKRVSVPLYTKMPRTELCRVAGGRKIASQRGKGGKREKKEERRRQSTSQLHAFKYIGQ